jgi:predicted membrane protein
MTPDSASHLPETPPRMQWPSLLLALAIMIVGTVYPPVMADAAGKADHRLATLLFLAMSAGFIRGVGFVPRHMLWRWLFSGWTCGLALLLAILVKLSH